MNLNSRNKLYFSAITGSFIFLCFIAYVLYSISEAGGREIINDLSTHIIIALLITLVLIVAGTIYLSNLFYYPLFRLLSTLQKISQGDLEARAGIKTQDEFGGIGEYIDTMLNERIMAFSSIEDENEQLNDSIIALLETVAQLAQKNLSIKATVNEDITGPLADALNLMSSETSKVLNSVTRISTEVAETSNLVKNQSDNVLLLANKEQEEVEKAASELKSAAETMSRIAKLAQASNISAEDAIKSTITAMSSVTDTVDSINRIRDTIRETEKKIKRLGERSQEIGTVVNLINNISERTHILALNASMHAASAGEAGRGFAVVADEVQRLAENTKDSTLQITTLVNNIQVETSGTVNTMNELITQVVGGSQLAEKAGQQMRETQSTTAELVNMVQRIADSAVDQEKTSNLLKERTDIIQESVRKTGTHLQEQTVHTDELVEQAMSLVASVSVFQLTEDEL